MKLVNNKPFNETLIQNEMSYINDGETVVNVLREKYPNDYTFKSYLVAFVVVVGHFPALRDSYLKITKLAKQLNKEILDTRNENTTEHPEKIIDLSNRQVLLDNIAKLPNITNKLVYAINVLIPTRRLENRLLRITDETNLDNLMDTDNYLVVKGPWKLVYNEYKTAAEFGQYTVDVPDDFKFFLQMYITAKKLKVGDYLFSLMRDKRELISQGNFSCKISNVFKKIYGVNISNKYLRYSASTTAERSNMSNKQRTKLAHDMGHSLTQHLLYSKHMSQN